MCFLDDCIECVSILCHINLRVLIPKIRDQNFGEVAVGTVVLRIYSPCHDEGSDGLCYPELEVGREGLMEIFWYWQ